MTSSKITCLLYLQALALRNKTVHMQQVKKGFKNENGFLLSKPFTRGLSPVRTDRNSKPAAFPRSVEMIESQVGCLFSWKIFKFYFILLLWYNEAY